MTSRDAYVAKMKLQLNELNAAMDQLEAKASEAKVEARAQYKVEMSKLRVQYQEALDKVEEIKTATDSTWEELVASTEKVRDAFINSFHYFKSQL